jgi:hypothetical protein
MRFDGRFVWFGWMGWNDGTSRLGPQTGPWVSELRVALDVLNRVALLARVGPRANAVLSISLSVAGSVHRVSALRNTFSNGARELHLVVVGRVRAGIGCSLPSICSI